MVAKNLVFPIFVEREGINYVINAEDRVVSNSYTFIARGGGKEIIVKMPREPLDKEFVNEVKILHEVGQHEAIVSLLGWDCSRQFLFLEKGEGALSNWNLMHAISFAQKRNMLKEIGGAIRYLHSLCIVHNDICCRNIITFGNRAKITDFGRSVLFGDQEEVSTVVYYPRNLYIKEIVHVKKDLIRKDCSDYIKTIYNVFGGNVADKQIPADFERELHHVKGEMGGEYNIWAQLFANAQKEMPPENIDEIINLL